MSSAKAALRDRGTELEWLRVPHQVSYVLPGKARRTDARQIRSLLVFFSDVGEAADLISSLELDGHKPVTTHRLWFVRLTFRSIEFSFQSADNGVEERVIALPVLGGPERVLRTLVEEFLERAGGPSSVIQIAYLDELPVEQDPSPWIEVIEVFLAATMNTRFDGIIVVLSEQGKLRAQVERRISQAFESVFHLG